MFHIKLNEGTIIELGGVKHRYHCALSRTVYIGKPDNKIDETLKITNEGVEKAIESTKPGNTCHDVAVAFWSVLEKYGLEKESRCGYSIGLGYPPDSLEPLTFSTYGGIGIFPIFINKLYNSFFEILNSSKIDFCSFFRTIAVISSFDPSLENYTNSIHFENQINQSRYYK